MGEVDWVFSLARCLCVSVGSRVGEEEGECFEDQRMKLEYSGSISISTRQQLDVQKAPIHCYPPTQYHQKTATEPLAKDYDLAGLGPT